MAERKSSTDIAQKLLRTVPTATTLGQPRGASNKDKLFDAADEAMMRDGGGTSRGASAAPRLVTLGVETAETIINAPLEKVHDNDYNARTSYDPEIVKQRASEIAADGQKTPALAVAHPSLPGEFMLVEGHYRKRALLLLKRPTIKLILRPDWTTPQQRFVQSWKANEERLANSPIDNAIQWARVIEEGIVRSQDELAELLGASASIVSKTLAISKLQALALERARKSPDVFTMSMLYEITALSKALPELDVPKLMDTIEAEGWSRRDLEQYKARHTNPVNRKPKETSRQHKILQEGAQVGVIKDWDNGRVLLDVKVPDQAAREQLVNELRKRFGLDSDAQITLK